LDIDPVQGDEQLLEYELTELEQTIMSAMDAATDQVSTDDDEQDLEACYEAIIPIGAKYGLDEQQSVAFWMRSTFSMFET